MSIDHSVADQRARNDQKRRSIIRWVEQAVKDAERTGNTAGVWLFADQWRLVRDAILAALSHPLPQGSEAMREALERLIAACDERGLEGQALEHARAALLPQSAEPSPDQFAGAGKAMPEGWMMVPREPTREMWAAGGDAVVGYKQRHHDKVVEQIWSVMLAASPQVPVGEPLREVQSADAAFHETGVSLKASPQVRA